MYERKSPKRSLALILVSESVNGKNRYRLYFFFGLFRGSIPDKLVGGYGKQTAEDENIPI